MGTTERDERAQTNKPHQHRHDSGGKSWLGTWQVLSAAPDPAASKRWRALPPRYGKMQSEEVEINFRSVAIQASVSTAWLYRTKSLRDKIMKARITSPAIGGEVPQHRQRLSQERI